MKEQKGSITKFSGFGKISSDLIQNTEDNTGILETFGSKTEKSKCLILQSQIETMREVFESVDKYNEQILKRSDFLMALRTDERVVEFIDVDAV